MTPRPGSQCRADVHLIGALLYSATADATAVLADVLDDDVESRALAVVLAAVRRLNAVGARHDPVLVLDELRRTGDVSQRGVTDALNAAATCGAEPLAAPQYATAVVAAALRREFESAGTALRSLAAEAPEEDLIERANVMARMIGDCAARLERLRQEDT